MILVQRVVPFAGGAWETVETMGQRERQEARVASVNMDQRCDIILLAANLDAASQMTLLTCWYEALNQPALAGML